MKRLITIVAFMIFLFVFGIFIAGVLAGTTVSSSIINIGNDPCVSILSNGKYNPKYRDILWKCSVSKKCDGAITVNQKTCDCECK